MMSRRYISSFWPESDGSTLTLDFTTGVLDSRLTFSRSTGGSYVHSDGLLYGFDTSSTSNTIGTGSKTFTISATAGVNRRYAVGDLIIASSGANNMSGSVTSYDPATQALVCNITGTPTGSGTFTTWIIGNRQPRFDHDPTTRAPRGLLVEGQSVNNCTYSQDFGNAVWLADNSGATNPSVSTVSQTAPDGSATVNRITFNKTGGAFSRIRNPVSGTASNPHTLSVWMKANTANGGAATQNVGLRIGADPAGFNCVVTTTWKRFQYTYTLSGTDANVQIMLWDNIVGNDETADVLIWGAMLEQGSGASSYLPTGASQGTRNPDNCELLDLTTMGFNASAGTIYTDVGTRLSTGSARNYTFLPASGSNNQIFEGSGIALNVYSSGSFVAQIGTSTISAQKIAAAYALNNYAVSVAGGAVATDTSGALPTSLTKLTIGGSIVNSSAYMNGCIRVFKYWPTRLPNAQLQSLTT
jgi:hypothetical protein